MSVTTIPALNIEALIASLEGSRTYFAKSTELLTEEDSGFKPTEDAFTVAGQVAHVAESIDWFLGAVENEEGFDMDFEAAFAKAAKVKSLNEARAWLDKAYERGLELLRTLDAEVWLSPLPEGPVMGGAPRLAVINGIVEHTAHHRGALTVYSRLQGKVPPMPYM